MKKINLILVAVAAFAAVSCVKEPENHQLAPDNYGSYLYADETVDTIGFYTFDSWRATESTDWLKLESESMNISYDYSKYYYCIIPFMIEENTTGKGRYCYVKVSSYDYSYSYPIVQYSHINILNVPDSVITHNSEYSQLADSVYWEIADSSFVLTDTLKFVDHTGNYKLSIVGGDAASSWLKIKDRQVVDKTGPAQTIYWPFEMEENTATEVRSAQLRLQTGHVNTYITVKQLPKKVTL